MSGNKISIANIYARIRTRNTIRHCNIGSDYSFYYRNGIKYQIEKYDGLEQIINKLENIDVLTISIKEINTLENFDIKMENLPCLLKKITFDMRPTSKNNFPFKNFNFIHHLKIPHGCKIEIYFGIFTYVITEICRYEYFIIKNNKNNDTLKVAYTKGFHFEYEKYIKYKSPDDKRISGLVSKYCYHDCAIQHENINNSFKHKIKMPKKTFNFYR